MRAIGDFLQFLKPDVPARGRCLAVAALFNEVMAGRELFMSGASQARGIVNLVSTSRMSNRVHVIDRRPVGIGIAGNPCVFAAIFPEIVSRSCLNALSRKVPFEVAGSKVRRASVAAVAGFDQMALPSIGTGEDVRRDVLPLAGLLCFSRRAWSAFRPFPGLRSKLSDCAMRRRLSPCQLRLLKIRRHRLVQTRLQIIPPRAVLV